MSVRGIFSICPQGVALTSQHAPIFLGVALVYFAAAKLGLALAVEEPQISTVWPPTGIALAAALRFGARALPGIFVGAFAANATVAQPLWVAAGIAGGNTLEALFGAYLVTRLQRETDPVRTAIGFFAAATLAPILSAFIGVACLVAGGVHAQGTFLEHFRLWWIGDALGALVLAPVLSFSAKRSNISPAAGVELGLLVGAAMLVCAAVFYQSSRLPFTEYIVFPFIIWAAMRLSVRATALVVAACDAVAVAATYSGFGPFTGLGPERGLLHLQIFIAVAATTGLLLAAVAERQRASEQAARARTQELEAESHQRAEAEEKLRQRDRELTDFLENATLGMHWVGPDGTILWANRAELDLLGYASDEYIGRNISEFHVDADVIRDILQRLKAGEQLHDYLARMRCKDDSIRDVLIHSNVLYEQGRFVHTRCFTRDITDRKRAEEALRESEGRFRELMEQAPFSVQIFSPDGRTLRANRAWEELWGATLENIGGYNVLEDAQLEAKGVLPYLRRAFAGEAVTVPAVRYDPRETLPDLVTSADPVRWVAAVAYPLKDQRGRVREVVLVHEDITARTLAEKGVHESEEKLRLLADTIPQLAWMAHADGYIFWYNRRWYEYTGTTPEAMEGWGWQSVHHPDVLPDVMERWQGSISAGEAFDMVFPLKGADHQFRPFLTRVNPLRDAEGRILYWCGTNTDISDIKQMEEALREADKRKDEFLATLAHELRNPLAPIANSLQILKLADLDSAAARQTREIMERQVHHLVRLVDDLLDVSRVMRGRVELRKVPVELATVVARAVETAQPLIQAQNHRLDISLQGESLLVTGDPVRLAQVLGNLLTNAAKYTEARGHISVFGWRENDQAILRVRDNGIGIAPDVLPHVFDLFVQAKHAASRSQGGLGIGLTLAKNLLEMHEGTIEAQSAGLGQGAEFTIRLPLAKQKREDAPAPVSGHPVKSVSQLRVLVVDDTRMRLRVWRSSYFSKGMTFG